MSLEDTKTTKEIGSSRELNLYLQAGWVLVLGYVKHTHDTQEPRFVVAWQNDEKPVHPEILDEWEKREIRRSKNR